MAQGGDTRERLWTDSEITDLLARAHEMGMDLSHGSDIEMYTLSELERLVTAVQ